LSAEQIKKVVTGKHAASSSICHNPRASKCAAHIHRRKYWAGKNGRSDAISNYRMANSHGRDSEISAVADLEHSKCRGMLQTNSG